MVRCWAWVLCELLDLLQDLEYLGEGSGLLYACTEIRIQNRYTIVPAPSGSNLIQVLATQSGTCTTIQHCTGSDRPNLQPRVKRMYRGLSTYQRSFGICNREELRYWRYATVSLWTHGDVILSRTVCEYVGIKAVPSEAHRLSTLMKHSGGKWRLSFCVNLTQPFLKRHDDRIHP